MNERFSGANAGSMFGEGVYFAEDGAKVDQYTGAGDRSTEALPLRHLLYPVGGGPTSVGNGVHYVFVCRVLLGCHVRTLDGNSSMEHGADLWATKKRRELACIPRSDVKYHSLLAELSRDLPGGGFQGRLKRFREIVVFHGETRVYPEYLLAYSRERV